VTPGGSVLDSIVICDAPEEQHAPSVSYVDSVYLVCWSGKNADFFNIFCARVSPDGTVLDENGFLIYPDSVSQITPTIVSNDNKFLVVWTEYDGSGCSIKAMRVSTDGSVSDSIPIIISQGSSSKYSPDVSFDGSNYMVIWDDARLTGTEYDEWAARITPDGILVDTNSIPIDTSPGYQFTPSISFNDPYYLAVWTDDKDGTPDIFGKHISPSGSVIEFPSFPICNEVGQQVEASCFAGIDNYLVAWNDGRLGYENTDIYGTFMDTTVAIEEKQDQRHKIQDIRLSAYPNPFTQKVEIRYGIPEITKIENRNLPISQFPISLSIYDACGRIIRSFPSSLLSLHSSVTWDGRDEEGKSISAGIYFCHLKQGKKDITKKILLVK